MAAAMIAAMIQISKNSRPKAAGSQTGAVISTQLKTDHCDIGTAFGWNALANMIPSVRRHWPRLPNEMLGLMSVLFFRSLSISLLLEYAVPAFITCSSYEQLTVNHWQERKCILDLCSILICLKAFSPSICVHCHRMWLLAEWADSGDADNSIFSF